MTRPPLLLLALLAPLTLSCRPTGKDPEPQRTTLVRGDRSQSASVKASENRPHPWADEHAPLESDRLALDQYRDRQRRRHAEGHSKQTLMLERFTHPACSGLSGKQLTTCPLVALRWGKARDIAGGVELRAPTGKVAGALMHRRVLCHIAFGHVGGADSCPFHMDGVRASVLERDGELRLRIVTDRADQVSELRRRVRALVP